MQVSSTEGLCLWFGAASLLLTIARESLNTVCRHYWEPLKTVCNRQVHALCVISVSAEIVQAMADSSAKKHALQREPRR